MPPRLVKILHEPGQWLAEVEGRRLAVLEFRHWNMHNKTYRQPLAQQGDPRCAEFLSALTANDLAVMHRDPGDPGANNVHDGLIGVFRFSDLVISPDAVALTLVERYASPRS